MSQDTQKPKMVILTAKYDLNGKVIRVNTELPLAMFIQGGQAMGIAIHQLQSKMSLAALQGSEEQGEPEPQQPAAEEVTPEAVTPETPNA